MFFAQHEHSLFATISFVVSQDLKYTSC